MHFSRTVTSPGDKAQCESVCVCVCESVCVCVLGVDGGSPVLPVPQASGPGYVWGAGAAATPQDSHQVSGGHYP